MPLWNRRHLIKTISAGVVSAAAGRRMSAGRVSSSGSAAADSDEIRVEVTAGDKRFAKDNSLRWEMPANVEPGEITVQPEIRYQTILGFGAALTDASCYVINELPADARAELIKEMFDPAGMGFGVCRLCMGASDYAREVYSYDEGTPDPELKRFSIDHDRPYVLPVIRAAREINPELFLFGSPWSPPGWMKVNGSMLGGMMEKKHFPAYASYFVKFLQSYEVAGARVNAVTIQNEVDTEQDGRMPASLWGQEYEAQFVSEHLGPAIANAKLGTKIWILDHNYNLWGRVLDELDDPEVNRYVDGVAWHGYFGQPAVMSRVHEAHPDKHMYWTEGGPALGASYATDWSNWGATFAGILRNWSRSIVSWNLALDENGKPNIGPFECAGLVTIDSKTKQISRSGQYWAFAHYSRAARRNSWRIDSTGEIEGVAHVAFGNPDGSTALVMTNHGAAREVPVRIAGRKTRAALAADSITTLSWG